MEGDEAQQFYKSSLMQVVFAGLDAGVDYAVLLGELAMAQHVVMATTVENARDYLETLTDSEKREQVKKFLDSTKGH